MKLNSVTTYLVITNFWYRIVLSADGKVLLPVWKNDKLLWIEDNPNFVKASLRQLIDWGVSDQQLYSSLFGLHEPLNRETWIIPHVPYLESNLLVSKVVYSASTSQISSGPLSFISTTGHTLCFFSKGFGWCKPICSTQQDHVINDFYPLFKIVGL